MNKIKKFMMKNKNSNLKRNYFILASSIYILFSHKIKEHIKKIRKYIPKNLKQYLTNQNIF